MLAHFVQDDDVGRMGEKEGTRKPEEQNALLKAAATRHGGQLPARADPQTARR